jgi:hypothetical protein
VNQIQLNQIDSEEGSTSRRNKRSTSVVVEQIHKMYNVVHRNEADDVVADFFLWKMEFHLMLLVHHIIKKW